MGNPLILLNTDGLYCHSWNKELLLKVAFRFHGPYYPFCWWKLILENSSCHYLLWSQNYNFIETYLYIIPSVPYHF